MTLNVPTDNEIRLAQAGVQPLAQYLATHKEEEHVEFRINGQRITFPIVALALFKDILLQMANGNAVSLIPVHAELTTQEAADFLNVSRPHLVKLLNEGKIPHRLVGTHRRVRFEDLRSYAASHKSVQRSALDEIASFDQEMGIEF